MSEDKKNLEDSMREALVIARNELYPEEEPTIETLQQLWDIMLSQKGIVSRQEIDKITSRDKLVKEFIEALKAEAKGQKKI